MPLSSGLSIHDDTKHKGSAKRDVNDGVAGIGAAGQLLVVGRKVALTRDGANNIEVTERTSGEAVARWTRIGASDYEFRLNCAAGFCEIQNDSMKDVANGIAGLDASALLPEALIPGIGEEYLISNNLLHSHDVELGPLYENSYTKRKTITLNALQPTPSTIRFKWDIKAGAGPSEVYSKIYKNGIAHGVEKYHVGTSWTTYSDDVSFEEGDTVELWVYVVDSGHSAYVKNFRVYGDEHVFTLAEAIVASDVGFANAWNVSNS